MVNKPAHSRSSPGDENYIKLLEARLSEKQAKLDYIKRKIRVAVEKDRINGSEQLYNAERQADSCVVAMQEQLIKLKAAGSDAWDRSKMDAEIAWEELSQSVKNLVSRFS